MKKQYSWKLDGLGKKEDPQKVAKEFERIQNVYGALTPENVVTEAQKKDSILSKFFEWDKDTAAMQYWLQQARTLINNIQITVISHGEPREVGAYEIVNVGDGREYKNVSEMTEQDIEDVKRVVLAEIEYLKKKLRFFSELQPALEYLEKAQSLLK